MTKPRIAIVVPAYNEAASLPGVIASLQAVQRSRDDWQWWVAVVNDGSTDDTDAVLASLAEEHELTEIHCPVNIGIGGAVQVGVQAAVHWGADVCVQVDGDGQHPSAAIPSLVEPVLAGRADIVVGSRYLEGAGGAVSHVGRQLGTRLFSWLLRLVVGCRVKDVTSGFRAFSQDASHFVSHYYPDDYPEVESYVPLARAGFRIEEIPVDMSARKGGRSSISWLLSPYYAIKVTLAVLIHLIRVLPTRRRNDREC
ncbi:MAG: glycosyltransferase family 2 protein [Deltaproteobacteria bacterium]|nr:glycosyltransferase family 2 protein [Deltaproteobacteria bacterium]